jgi:phosphoribosyl-ATP pyrophosphohydrolase
MTDNILQSLYETILARRGGDAASSYTASLLAKGTARIAQKVGEEAIETCFAAAQADKAGVKNESADLLYHLLVLWADQGITPEDVFETLRAREGVSGIAEKNARK